MKLIVECPLNSLSFGNVSYNILREFWKLNLEVGLFPIGENVDVSAFDKMRPEFRGWLQSSIDNRYKNVDRDTPTFKLWHLNGSDYLRTPNQFLYTFYELDQPTDIEKTISKLQSKTIFSSSFARDLFGQDNSTYIPIGFDEDLVKTDKQYLGDDVVHFGLMGKFENRKHTKKIIQLWIKKFGNNPKYQLSCCITNPFIDERSMSAIVFDITGGEQYNNVNFLPYLKTNSEVNDYINAIDIELSGLSGAEGWNLPAFNAICMGKHAIVLNHTSHKDWASHDNSLLLEPSGQASAADGMFFNEAGDFNQGNINIFNDEEVLEALGKITEKKGTENENGVKLKEVFSYKNTASKILDLINQ